MSICRPFSCVEWPSISPPWRSPMSPTATGGASGFRTVIGGQPRAVRRARPGSRPSACDPSRRSAARGSSRRSGRDRLRGTALHPTRAAVAGRTVRLRSVPVAVRHPAALSRKQSRPLRDRQLTARRTTTDRRAIHRVLGVPRRATRAGRRSRDRRCKSPDASIAPGCRLSAGRCCSATARPPASRASLSPDP